MTSPEPSKERPVVYATLYDVRTDQLRRQVEERLASEAGKAAHAATGWVTEAIREAYIAGVSDGFAQGVKAEADEKP